MKRYVRCWLILLQKSKIERRRKSRKSRCLDVSTAAMLARADTKVRGRYCAKRCGPSRRRVRTASAVVKNFIRQPEKTFQQYLHETDMPKYLGDVRCWVNSGKVMLSRSFSGFDLPAHWAF